MAQGRKELPQVIKQLKGTEQPCRVNKNKPKYDKLNVLPKVPAILNSNGKSIYKKTGKELINKGLLNLVNIEMFIAYCNEAGLYYSYMNQLNKEGHIIDEYTRTGIKQVINPKRKLAYESLDKARQIGAEFGITPASENKVSTPTSTPGDEFNEYLNS